MTRLKQALRWWKNHDFGDYEPIPPRHFDVLKRNGLLTDEDEDGSVGLNQEGKALLDAYGFLS